MVARRSSWKKKRNLLQRSHTPNWPPKGSIKSKTPTTTSHSQLDARLPIAYTELKHKKKYAPIKVHHMGSGFVSGGGPANCASRPFKGVRGAKNILSSVGDILNGTYRTLIPSKTKRRGVSVLVAKGFGLRDLISPRPRR